jgi:hypothetical protein
MMATFTNRCEEIKAAITAGYQAMGLIGLCGTAADQLWSGGSAESSTQTASDISNAAEVARELIGKALDVLEMVEGETRSAEVSK